MSDSEVSTAARRPLSWVWAIVIGLGALVATLFALVGLASALLPDPDPQDFGEGAGVSPVVGLLLALFFAPMATLFWRATWLVLRGRRGAAARPLLTPPLAWAIALAYGLPGLLAALYTAINTPSRMLEALYVLPVTVMLLSAPLLAKRHQGSRR